MVAARTRGVAPRTTKHLSWLPGSIRNCCVTGTRRRRSESGDRPHHHPSGQHGTRRRAREGLSDPRERWSVEVGETLQVT
jgi:hypothetical protein